MPGWLLNILASIGTIIITLTVTLLFNKFVGLPKELKKQKELEKQREEQLKLENKARDTKIAELEQTINNCVNNLPTYRAQSLQIQSELKNTDDKILAACNSIKDSLIETQKSLDARLDRLEKRDKNSIRAKLLDEHRLFTDPIKNPLLAWSEMEHHAFFELIKDYEELKGNDYVHSTVISDMNRLAVIPMADKVALAELMASRKL
jgi:hypothetical protein